MKKPVLILILALVAGGGFAFWIWRSQVAEADRPLILHGNVDIREVNLGFRVSGRIEEMRVDEGDVVKSGDVLARLDAEPYRRELERANAEVASLEANLARLKHGYRREEIARAAAILDERRATLENAKRNFDRQSELIGTRATSKQDFDAAKARLDEVEAQVESASAELERLKAGFREEEIAQAQAELDRAKASVGMTEIKVEDTELKSPSDGVVLTRAMEEGAIVQAGETVLTVSLEKPVWARVYVDEPHLGDVHPGMEVEVYTDSRPNRPYHGKVGFISPRAEFTPKNVETEALRTALVYRLRVVVSDPDPGLRQGMPVTVKPR